MNNEEKRRELLEKIGKIESQITSLNEQKRKLVCELDILRRDIFSNICEPSFQSYNITSVKKSRVLEPFTAEKIDLFRSLFRGRDDVYARLWISKKTGKAGYSPVCKNEWVREICKKPIMKCSQCPHRKFSPLIDNAIHKHLGGIHIVGIYPILQDETCYFLAVDFDKEG